MKNIKVIDNHLLSLIFAVCALISIFGCASAPEGCIEVSNRLRLFDTKLISDIAGSTEIKIAVARGNWGNNFFLENVNIKQGSMTISGENGNITFLPNDKILVTIAGYCDRREFPFRFHCLAFSCNKTAAIKIEGLADTEYGLLQSLEEEFLKRGLDIKNFCLYLPITETEEYYLMTIKIKTSPNFVGYGGDLFIASNWYDDL